MKKQKTYQNVIDTALEDQPLVEVAEANQAQVVPRDAKGRVVKGGRLNVSGIERRKAHTLKMLESLTPVAVNRLAQLVRSENEPVALGAIKEVLDRTQGKAKQAVTVDVTSTHVLHLQALEELARRSRDAGLIDVTPVKGSEGSEGE